MKQYIKGFSIQLLINISLNLIRILVAFLIRKYVLSDSIYDFRNKVYNIYGASIRSLF